MKDRKMTNHIHLTKNRLSNNIADGKSRHHNRISFWNFGAGVGFVGGLMFFLGTIFLVVTDFFYGEKEHGIWLFPFAFLLLIFGAHCLDKIDDIRKEKIADYEKRKCTAENFEEETCRNQRFR